MKLEGLDLCKNYGKKNVVNKVSPKLEQGEVVGLLGPNGAGKTTTFYMLTGIIKPTAGRVLFNDTDITHWPLHDRARIGISYLPQESSIFRRLTVRENLQIMFEYTDFSKKEQAERADNLLEEFGLTRLANSQALQLSGGERRRLEIARALIREPQCILLDEPFAGIDPLAVGDIQDIIRILCKKGIGVLISDHNVRETLSICDRAYLMVEGQVALYGTPKEIVDNPQARTMYLGEAFSL